MASNFPESLDSFTPKVDGVDVVYASHLNALQDAVAAIETELGVTPKGSFDDVAQAISAKLDTAGGTITGDVTCDTGIELDGVDVSEFKSDYDTLESSVSSYLPTSDEKAALAGTGTPSAENLFVTEDYANLPTTAEKAALADIVDMSTLDIIILPMNAADGSPVFFDTSFFNNAVNPGGGIAHSGGKAVFDGTDDKLTIPNKNLFAFSNYSFIIHFKWTYTAGSGVHTFFALNDNNPFTLSWDESSGVFTFAGLNATIITSSAQSLVGSTEYTVALTREGSTFTLTLDNTSIGTGSNSGIFNAPTSTNPVVIGTSISNSNWLKGSMRDFYIRRGTSAAL